MWSEQEDFILTFMSIFPVCHVYVPQRVEEGVESPGTRGTGICEPPDMGAENRALVTE